MCGLIWLNRLPPDHPFQYPSAALAIRFRGTHRLLPLWRGVGAGSVGLWRGGEAEGFPDFGPDACAQTGACLDFSIGSSSESRGVKD